MQDSTKQFLKNVVVSTAEKAAVAVGTYMVAHNLLASGAAADNFEQTLTGFIVACVGVLFNWYREYGHAMVSAELNKMKAVAAPAKQ